MIPRTYPSTFDATGASQMTVIFLSSVTGLTAWVDYIPVQQVLSPLPEKAGTYDLNGFTNVAPLAVTIGAVAFRDYIPVYNDAAATKPWSTDVGGFIPVNGDDYAQIIALTGMGPLWDFSDKSTMFQDSAGTQPVTAFGQPVGRVLDKSGKWPALIQPTTPNRPIYALDANGKPSLSFNGTNQWMQTNGNLDLSGTDKLTLVAGGRRLTDAVNMYVELSSSINASPGFFLCGSYIGHRDNCPGVNFGGGVYSQSTLSGANNVLPLSAVITAQLDGSQPTNLLRLSARQNTTPASGSEFGSTSTGTLSNAPLYVGSRNGATYFFNGNIHTIAIRLNLSTQPEIDLLERFANSRTGAYA